MIPEYTVNPRFKPRGLIDFVVHNHPVSNRERIEIDTSKDLNFLIWMGELTRVQFDTRFDLRPRLYSRKYIPWVQIERGLK